MKILLLSFIFLVSESLGCKKTISRNYGFGYSYREIIANATIVCSNLYSIEEIYYEYSTESYEQYLKITNSNVTTLKPNDFKKFDTIRKLFLSEIHLKVIQPNAFLGLTYLKELYLNNNEIKTIYDKLFAPLAHLKVLDLSHNKIVQIEQEGFNGLFALTDLFLQDNALVKLEDTLFSELTHLTNLDLSSNPLEKIPTSGIPSLDYIGVGNTSIKEFGFVKNLKVDILNLTSNRLKSFDFLTMPNLTVLDLTNNELESLKNIEFLRAEKLYLSFNKIKKFDSSLKHIFRIEASHNQLERIDKTLFGESQTIQLIDFSYNKISTIETDSFQELSQLKYLYLQNNNISNIEVNLFKDLVLLQTLDLSHNVIKSITYGTFSKLKHLTFLDLSYNKLTKLPTSVLYPSSDLKYLNINHNQILTLDGEDLVTHIPNLLELSLDGNIWKCRQLTQIDKFLHKINAKLAEGKSYEVENHNGIACENDDHLQLAPSSDSFTGLIQDFQTAINNTLQNSKLRKFLNEDFEKSNFAQFFREIDHKKFGEFLDNNNQSEAGGNVEKEGESEDSGIGTVGVVSVCLQVIMCSILIAMVCFVYRFLKKNLEIRKRSNWTIEEELLGDS